MTVHILGAGVAGLSCALAFLRRGEEQDVVVYERDDAEALPLRAGHGLILMQNGVDALKVLGCEHVLEDCAPITQALLQSEQGLTLRTDELDHVHCVTRAGIVEGLRRQLPEGVVRLGHGCERVLFEPGRKGAEDRRVRGLQFENGSLVTLEPDDLLIGADGVRSVLYRALNPGIERTKSSVKEVVTMTHMPDLARQLRGRFLKTLFPERGLAFGLLAPTAHDVIGFLQFDSERYEPLPRGATAEEYRDFLSGLMATAPEPVPTYLERANLESAHTWHPINAELPPTLHGDNAVLIGDAAHPLLPFTSQGVAAALEDSIILVDTLAAGGQSRDQLLAGFSADRRRDLTAYVEGGRRILSSFVDVSDSFALPYVDGAASKLADHLNLPPGSIHGVFRALDTDGDGRLTDDEFAQALILFDVSLTDDDRRQLFREIDTDGSGSLETSEVIEALGGEGDEASELLRSVRARLSPRRRQTLALRGRLQAAFRLMDTDGSGSIDFSEFSFALTLLGLFLTEEEARELFASVDRSRDELIDFEELHRAVTSGEGVRAAVAAQLRSKSLVDDLERDEDFDDEAVVLPVLRERAFNYRWAEQPEGVIPLTAADADFPVAPVIQSALTEYIQGGYWSYGPPAGLPDFRQAAAEHFVTERGIPCSPGHVLATNSAASGMYLVAERTLQPGDEALIADPVDFLFERSVAAAGGRVRRYRLRFDDNWSFDPEEVEALITPRTRLLSICNPHNPLGRVWTADELNALTEIALRHDLWILSDEVWADIVHPPNRLTSVASLSPEVAARTFTVYGFSKGHGLAGLRLGVLACPSPEEMETILRQCHADETAYGVSTLSQVAGTAALREAKPWLERFLGHLVQQRNIAVGRLRQMPGVECHVPEGTFVVFPDISALGLDVEPLVARLAEQYQIAVVPGSPRFFGPAAAGHVRLSYATSPGILTEGLDRLERGLRELSG